MKPLIATAAKGTLSAAQAQEAFSCIFDGSATAAQMGGLLMAMQTRGETITEYAAAAAAMRAKCAAIKAPEGAIDIVGTGGDGKGTLNISTATAFVVAGAGVCVAKHGNKNISSLSGAGDILQQMGINVMIEAEHAEHAINQIGIGFMMAPMHHPAIRHVMPVRQELGCRTIFNILGPLTNPAAVKYQLTGAFDMALIEPMAETLKVLGTEAAWLVHGADGTDEISICGPTDVAILADNTVTKAQIHPEDARLPAHPFEHIKGGTPAYNADAFRALLAGAPSAYRDAVLLNSAAALVIVKKANDLTEGAQMAAASIDSGAAQAKLTALAKHTNAQA